ncbi:glutaredoxin family protein [Macrococcus equipercicus]|uniref:Glutaredoxin family protein n=1 Tax=Macrococcus equipercicus TaxID=69967 RepID=A0A9Q9BPX0_9STAP|nr:glutaredoxin family protein [Macrococcus equipercicus]KAA1042654.1 glutaredoxin family protein [Macrococcus equipercicus]UTH14520.1 glutaredoxin family protein [Macrococcus equipercicus]
MNITIYTQNQCPPCAFIKRYLAEKSIPYTEKNIRNPRYRREMMDYDAFSTPLIIMGDEVIRTVDIARIEARLQEVQHD